MRTSKVEHGRARLVALLFATLFLVGCASARGGGAVVDGESATLRVENRAYTDMTIYVVIGGADRRRLGVASSVGASSMTIPASIIGAGRELQFLADPVGARGSATTRRIWVYPGEEVTLEIPPG